MSSDGSPEVLGLGWRLYLEVEDAHGYSDGYDQEQANWLNYVADELQALVKWQSPPPNVPPRELVKIRVTGPVHIDECPEWIKVELVGR